MIKKSNASSSIRNLKLSSPYPIQRDPSISLRLVPRRTSKCGILTLDGINSSGIKSPILSMKEARLLTFTVLLIMKIEKSLSGISMMEPIKNGE
jgi:hypothetical protein